MIQAVPTLSGQGEGNRKVSNYLKRQKCYNRCKSKVQQEDRQGRPKLEETWEDRP